MCWLSLWQAVLLEKKRQYSKEQYDIKVKGLFPNKSDGFLLGRSEVDDACFGFNPIDDHEEWGYVLPIDVGGGDFRDDSVMTVARVIGFGQFGAEARRVYIEEIPIVDNTQNTVEFARRSHRCSQQYSNPTVPIDKGGMGTAFIHNMEELGTSNIHKVVWGNPCFKKELKETFVNLRSQSLILSQYSGNGAGMKNGKGLVGSQYEYYTPKAVAEGMWTLLNEMGFAGGKVLDPCAGTGIFSLNAPENALMHSIELSDESSVRTIAINSKPSIKLNWFCSQSTFSLLLKMFGDLSNA